MAGEVGEIEIAVGVNIDPPVEQNFSTSKFVSFTNVASNHAEFIAVYGEFDGAVYLDTTNNLLRFRADGNWEIIPFGDTISRFKQSDDNTVWNGSLATKIYTVSASIADARNAVWVFRNAAGETFFPDYALTLTQVTVTFGIAPASDTYILIGVE